MNLDRFKAAFEATAQSKKDSQTSGDFGVKNLERVLDALGGRTFNHGLYRVFRSDQIPEARKAMERVYPEYAGRIVPFAFDWLGRHFASDLKRVERGEPQILMLEVGAGAAMQIPSSIVDFHNAELVDYANEALAAQFWQEWHDANPSDVGFDSCVGYKVPLFLGGPDVVANLEIIDLSVYVEICGQLRNKTKSLKPGQSIRSVHMGK